MACCCVVAFADLGFAVSCASGYHLIFQREEGRESRDYAEREVATYYHYYYFNGLSME